MHKLFLIIGSLSAALAVIFGAFGAHYLKTKITPEASVTFQVGVQYHLFHSAGLMLIGVLAGMLNGQGKLLLAGWLMFMGTLLFSGSLYALSVTGIKAIGMITPVGGTLFIVSWILVAVSMMQAT